MTRIRFRDLWSIMAWATIFWSSHAIRECNKRLTAKCNRVVNRWDCEQPDALRKARSMEYYNRNCALSTLSNLAISLNASIATEGRLCIDCFGKDSRRL